MVWTSNWRSSLWMLAALWLLTATLASPVKRATRDLEARRRSAIERNLVRLGRSYPAEPTAAEIREAFQRNLRRGNSFLRLGRSQPISLTPEDLYMALEQQPYDDEAKRSADFIRLGRDPQFIRFGRSNDEAEVADNNGFPQRKGRARDHFVRLGRDSEEIADEDELDRKKRSLTSCEDCQA